MNKHRINIFIALVLVLIIIAAVSMWLTSRDIKDTVPTESAQPTPALTPSVISTPTPAPTESAQPTQSAVINRTINQTGSFESNTGTKMIMYANWTATSQNSETVTIKLDVILSTYTLSVGPHNGVITVAGVDYSFTSPGISYKSEKVRNNAVLTSRSIEVTVPAGQATAIPVSVKWDFYGTYGGVEISRVSAGGTINIQG
jgi:biopolymer transport protein ExbD